MGEQAVQDAAARALRLVILLGIVSLFEALDRVGAVLGPLTVAAVLHFGGGYPTGFGILLVPALLALSVLLAARLLYPLPLISKWVWERRSPS